MADVEIDENGNATVTGSEQGDVIVKPDAQEASSLTVNAGGGHDYLDMGSGFGRNLNVEKVQINTGAGDDYVIYARTSNPTDITISGGKGNDYITASYVSLQDEGKITVDGNEGDDTLHAQQTEEVIYTGGKGEDTFRTSVLPAERQGLTSNITVTDFSLEDCDKLSIIIERDSEGNIPSEVLEVIGGEDRYGAIAEANISALLELAQYNLPENIDAKDLQAELKSFKTESWPHYDKLADADFAQVLQESDEGRSERSRFTDEIVITGHNQEGQCLSTMVIGAADTDEISSPVGPVSGGEREIT